MANLYSSLKTGSLPSAGTGWVYASDQYRIYHITPSVKPDSRAKWDRVGHSIMRSVNPDYISIRSYTGEIGMVVGSTRWDPVSLKEVMERECFQASAGDVTYTVEEGTGIWGDGSIDEEYFGITTPRVDENFTYWRNDTTMLANDGANYFLNDIRTTATRPSETEENWIDAEYGEKSLIEAASLATNYNLGNFFDGTGRYNEFPLDLAITNGSNLRLYHFDMDEIDPGDWNRSTGEALEGGDYEGTGRNLYNYGDYMDQFLGTVNPLMYCFSQDHEDDETDNRLYLFAENDKFGAGSGFALSEFISGIGGDLGTGINDAGMVVVSPYFIDKTV